MPRGYGQHSHSLCYSFLLLLSFGEKGAANPGEPSPHVLLAPPRRTSPRASSAKALSVDLGRSHACSEAFVDFCLQFIIF